MKEISFDDVRVLEAHRFKSVHINKARTREKVFQEYNNEKYPQLAGAMTFEEALLQYRGPSHETVFSRHNHFYTGSTDEANALRESLVLSSLHPLLEGVDTVVELGAGFGQMLEHIRRAYPNLRYIGAEFSPVAREIGARVAPEINFVPFDFYDDTWNIFDGLQNVLVLSFHAIEMVSDARSVFKKLEAHRSHIRALSLFEPVYEEGESDILTERRHYIESHDYSRNILQSFVFDEIERDFFGLNPLFPEARMSAQYRV